ncbi:MAG: uroporphyrinogen-III synthase, partial [Acidimicrobiales bacterium]
MADTRPLGGVTVVITRARDQAAPLARRLADLGAHVVEAPVIDIVGPADGGAALRRAVAEAANGMYDWLVVTSTNGADRVVAALGAERTLPATRVAAIGPATAAVLERAGVVVDLVPERYVA